MSCTVAVAMLVVPAHRFRGATMTGSGGGCGGKAKAAEQAPLCGGTRERTTRDAFVEAGLLG